MGQIARTATLLDGIDPEKVHLEGHPLTGEGGLRGNDKAGADLRDQSSGTNQEAHIEEGRSSDQPGADVRGDIAVHRTVRDLPEGLKRERKGPLSPTKGRGGESTQRSIS